MWGSRSIKKEQKLSTWGVNVKAENLITGMILGFVLGFISDFFMNSMGSIGRGSTPSSKSGKSSVSPSDDDELKMVLVVRQDLKMGTGKIASQCAHAAVGMYDELLHSQRSLLTQWWQCGQPKIVVKCKNQREMDRLKDEAENVGLPTFIVADAGRTQISAGSRTVLVIGPGSFKLPCLMSRGKKNLHLEQNRLWILSLENCISYDKEAGSAPQVSLTSVYDDWKPGWDVELKLVRKFDEFMCSLSDELEKVPDQFLPN